LRLPLLPTTLTFLAANIAFSSPIWFKAHANGYGVRCRFRLWPLQIPTLVDLAIQQVEFGFVDFEKAQQEVNLYYPDVPTIDISTFLEATERRVFNAGKKCHVALKATALDPGIPDDLALLLSQSDPEGPFWWWRRRIVQLA